MIAHAQPGLDQVYDEYSYVEERRCELRALALPPRRYPCSTDTLERRGATQIKHGVCNPESVESRDVRRKCLKNKYAIAANGLQLGLKSTIRSSPSAVEMHHAGGRG